VGRARELEKEAFKLMEPEKIKTIEDLKQVLKEWFLDSGVEVYLFGSRARGDERPYSDVDIALVCKEGGDISKKLTLFRELLEESHLPYKVDLVEIAEGSRLLNVVRREGKRWV